MANPRTVFPGSAHDHEVCVDAALAKAERVCRRQGARLTPLRRAVLELVWRRHQPVGAYEILEALRRRHRGAVPPTVYRALDFLMQRGLVHRIASLNAFVGCPRPDRPHVSQFLICSGCAAAAELGDETIATAVRRRAEALGFAVERQTIEVNGWCPRCREGRQTPP